MTLRRALSPALLWVSAMLALAAPEEARRWNLISIVSDDQARWSLGAYGSRDARTPNLDRLAQSGALFRTAFTVTPVCSPSRATFLTGFYGTDVGITDWITPEEADAGLGLPPDTIIWPKVLHDQGYTTALFGKWHLGALPRFQPTRFGFDQYFGFLGGGAKPINPILITNGEPREFSGPCPDILTDAAMQFLDENQSRPFAVLVHYREPHLPYLPVAEQDAAPFKGLDPAVPDWPGLDADKIKRWTRDYYASVHAMDRNVGRLLAKLDELKLADQTIVLFTSDHGYNLGHHGLHTKGNAKWIAGPEKNKTRPNLFEESIRIPMIVRWPGVVKPGTEIPELVLNLDVFPTVLGMLNVPMPAAFRPRGVDVSPLLRGKRIPARKAVFAQYDLHNDATAHLRMIRTDRWKLVRHYFEIGQDELYDLETDPGETKNLYADPEASQERDKLQNQLTQWMRSIDDPLLVRLQEETVLRQ